MAKVLMQLLLWYHLYLAHGDQIPCCESLDCFHDSLAFKVSINHQLGDCKGAKFACGTVDHHVHEEFRVTLEVFRAVVDEWVD